MSPATALAFPPRQEVEQTLAKLEHISAQLDEVRTIQDAKQIHDVLKATCTYAREQRLGREIIQKARAVTFDALRRIGDLLRETERAPGGQPYQRATGSKWGPVATLAELGISKKTSSKAQQLFSLPLDVFERVRDGHTTLDRVLADMKRAADLEARRADLEARRAAWEPDVSSAVYVGVGSCTELLAACMPDIVVTEPPRGEADLPLFSELARACVSVPLVAVRVTTRFLPQALERLCAHLKYKDARIDDNKGALTLWFCQDEAAFDRAQARASGLDPSEAWIEYFVQRFAGPGDLVCDPFLQAATAIAARDHARRFVGASLDESVVADVRRQVGLAS